MDFENENFMCVKKKNDCDNWIDLNKKSNMIILASLFVFGYVGYSIIQMDMYMFLVSLLIIMIIV